MKLLIEGKNPGEGYFPEQGLLPHYLALCVYQLMEARGRVDQILGQSNSEAT